MNRFLAAMISLTIAAGLCITEYLCVKNSADKFISQIENIEKAMHEENIETALEYANNINKDWQETVSIVDMLLYHDYVDQIGTDLSTLSVYIQFDEEAELYATCEKAKRQLITLKENEKLTAENLI